MANRLRAHLPLVGILVVAGIAGTATLTYAAGRQLSTSTGTVAAVAPKPPLVVPDVQGQAFVFAKGALEDAGFAWRVAGSVHGYAANIVESQTPAPGTRVVDTGAPLVSVSLKRNGSYAQTGVAEDASPYEASALQPVGLASAVGPAHPATDATVTTPAPAATATTPAATTPTTTTRAPAASKPATVKQAAAAWPQNRPPAFTVPGAKREPLDEMPLTSRAQLLRRFVEAHPKASSANVSHWLYQQAWIVTGAKLGWWHGAQALVTLSAVDRRVQQLWGMGSKSALQVQLALAEVQSKSK
jgi:hypothetical protein